MRNTFLKNINIHIFNNSMMLSPSAYYNIAQDNHRWMWGKYLLYISSVEALARTISKVSKVGHYEIIFILLPFGILFKYIVIVLWVSTLFYLLLVIVSKSIQPSVFKRIFTVTMYCTLIKMFEKCFSLIIGLIRYINKTDNYITMPNAAGANSILFVNTSDAIQKTAQDINVFDLWFYTALITGISTILRISIKKTSVIVLVIAIVETSIKIMLFNLLRWVK